MRPPQPEGPFTAAPTSPILKALHVELKGGLLSIHDGIVTLDETEVPVILGVERDRIRLSAAGQEIGEWPVEECSIDEVGDGVYTITAEDESLRFIPHDPTLFASVLGFNRVPPPPGTVDGSDPVEPDHGGQEQEPAVHFGDEAPPPRQTTMILFYALVTVTVALGLWALITLLV